MRAAKAVKRNHLRGERGLPGPPRKTWPRGTERRDWFPRKRGTERSRWFEGPTRSNRPAGKIRNLKNMAAQVEYLDRSIENVYNELGTHIKRMTQLQQELDSLREAVRQLAARLEN